MFRRFQWSVLFVAVVGGFALAGPHACKGSGSPAPSTPAPTFPGSAKMEEAGALAAKGRLSAASDALAEAQRQLEEAAPLRILNLTVADASPQGFGLYTEKAGATLSSNQPLILYFEPNGFSRAPSGNTWTVDLSADVNLYAPPQTEPFVSQPGFVVLKVTGQQPNREVFMSATLHLSGVPAGKYVAEIRLADNVGKETATARVPFTLK